MRIGSFILFISVIVFTLIRFHLSAALKIFINKCRRGVIDLENRVSKRTNVENPILSIQMLVCFLFFICLALVVPLTFGDDLDWGGAAGISRMQNLFDNYNGRYLGNMIIISITRSVVLRVIFYALINTTIVYAIMKLTKATYRYMPFIITSLLILVPYRVYAQTFSWFSGFANYNVGIALTLLIWVWVLRSTEVLYPVKLISILIVSFLAQLCMENITMFNVLFSIIFLIVLFKQKFVTYRISYVIGSIAGAALMFSNSVYHSIASGDDYYRTFDWDKLSEVFITHYMETYLINNWLILLVIAGLVWLLYDNKNKLSLFPMTIITAFPILGLTISIAGIPLTEFSELLGYLISGLAIFYLIMLVVAILLLPKDRIDQKFWYIFLCGISSGIILAPFLIVQPFGPRSGLTSYVFFVIIAVFLLNAVLEQEFSKKGLQRLTYFTIVLFSSVALVYIGMHSVNLFYFNKRDQIMKVDHKNKKVTVERLPFDKYTHYISPPNYGDIAPRTFREKYDIPEDYKVVSVPYGLNRNK